MADIVTPIVTQGGGAALQLLEDKLKELANGITTPWQKAIVTATEELLAQNGANGLQNIADIVQTILSGKAPDITSLSLRSASEILAEMQRVEADHKKDVQAFMNTLMSSLGTVMAQVLTVVLASL